MRAGISNPKGEDDQVNREARLHSLHVVLKFCLIEKQNKGEREGGMEEGGVRERLHLLMPFPNSHNRQRWASLKLEP